MEEEIWRKMKVTEKKHTAMIAFKKILYRRWKKITTRSWKENKRRKSSLSKQRAKKQRRKIDSHISCIPKKGK